MWGKNYAYMISEGLNRGENFIRGAAGNIGKTIMDTIIPLLDFFGLLRSLVMGKEKLDLEAKEPEEGGFLSWLWEAATSGFEAMKLNISAVLDTVAGFAFALWRGLVDDVIPMVIELAEKAGNWLWDIMKWAYGKVQGTFDMVIDLSEKAWGWLWDVMLWMYRGVWRTFGMLINIAKGIGNWLWNVLEWAYSGITKVIDVTVNLLKGAGGALWNAITSTAAALIPGMQMGGPINQTGLYMLHRGEYVVPKKNVSAGAGGNNINVYVNLSSNISSQMDIKRVSEELGREIARDIEKRLGVF
jgi:hypothetical protein